MLTTRSTTGQRLRSTNPSNISSPSKSRVPCQQIYPNHCRAYSSLITNENPSRQPDPARIPIRRSTLGTVQRKQQGGARKNRGPAYVPSCQLDRVMVPPASRRQDTVGSGVPVAAQRSVTFVPSRTIMSVLVG